MRELIPIRESADGAKAVSAKDLYDFLGIKTAFTIWIERMMEYGFSQNVDYQAIIIFEPHKNGFGGTKKVADYVLTLDTAKEIAMIQRTAKGKEARQYFIAVEKAFFGHQAPNDSDEVAMMNGLAAMQRVMQREQAKLIAAEATIANLAPKADYAEKVLASISEITTTTIAKDLHMGASALNKLLHQKGVQFKNTDDVWVLYAKHDGKGYTETRTKYYRNPYTNEISTKIYTVWTEAGRNFIHQLLNPKLQGVAKK